MIHALDSTDEEREQGWETKIKKACPLYFCLVWKGAGKLQVEKISDSCGGRSQFGPFVLLQFSVSVFKAILEPVNLTESQTETFLISCKYF